MNLLLMIGTFLLSVFPGVLIVDLIWREEEIAALMFKLFLGIGVGLGLSSFAYFLYLLFFAGQHFFIYIQIGISVIVLLISLSLGRAKYRITFHGFQLKYWQVGLLITVILTIVFSIFGASVVWTHRPSGTWDAFMIYNRTARFLYRDQIHWLQSFSKQIDPSFEANYPLLIQLNVASGWDVLGHETTVVPLILSGLFMAACAGLFVCALTITKSIWQAGVGLIVLLNTTFFIMNGASQTADVPLSFYTLSTVVLIYLYVLKQNPRLLILAGLTSGLAGWTKNEGGLFIFTTLAAMFISFKKPFPWRLLGCYLAGLMVPLAFIVYFKLFLAPPNDVLGNSLARSMQQLLEWPRHLTILQAYVWYIIQFGQSAIGLIPVLLVYALIFNFAPDKRLQPAYQTILLIVGLQMTGYYLIYLITPYPLEWQLTFSLERVLLPMFLPLLFLFFVLGTDIQAALNFKHKVQQSENTI